MKVRHILGISGGKDSAALAIYLKDHYPQIPFEFYNSDTKCELLETETLINRLASYLGGITRLVAVEKAPNPHHLTISIRYTEDTSHRLRLAGVRKNETGEDGRICW